ncbi:hypothetical protein KVP40.0326 [Vibrio phage KVP40]|uniref:Uncharacterized protein n=2 Tax=Schizotequatrovirus KVP40 TaxID=1914019 RepID=Q6WHH7_BPKVM|nr:hypothetical protein KVP40.0326 [Vibrio phage KVP40]QHJ74508.1 hypothetical protein VH12019_00208 [Vibrio phage VH1_2019]UNA01839.1 hypothetical protein [Vibrio phage PC-Liy1]URQ03136.1 hypothetical protein PVA8_150 [Vibrio phage PVA8]WBM58871.1 hypothetical protein vBValMPVA8_149 [Vibrio phage vB_ValM_PVA8]WOL24856.1 hypothetical protein [Vibrio phage PG216]
MAADDKKMNEIIGRLDHIILQQEDRPEVYTMQRVARHINNIDITTTSMLETMQSVFKTNEKAVAQQKNLFQRVIENFEQTSNKVRASIISLTDIIKTTLDFKGHLSRIDRGIQEMRLTAKMQFARMQEGFNRWFERLIFRVNDMKRVIGLQKTAADDLNSFLQNGAGNNAPLTVGFISALYKKIFAYQVVTETRNRKTEQLRYKENMKVQRNQASDLRRIANHLAGEKLGWIAKLFRLVGVGLVMLGGQLVTFSTSMAMAASTATKFGTLGKIASNILLGFGKFSKGTGNIVQALATDMSGTIKGWMWTVVRQLFLGLGRMVAIMLNPAALVAMVAGYGIYKIFEEELDRIFAALKNIFSDPEKRAMLFSIISNWFTDMVRGIGEWFGIVGENIKDAVPEGAVEGIVSGFEKVTSFVRSAFQMYVNAVNKIIASWLSIPDSFRLLMLAIDDLMLNVKEFVVNALNALPDFLKSEGMEKFIAGADIEGNRARIDASKAEVKDRLNARYQTDYLGKAGDMIVDGAKNTAQAVIDGAKNAADAIKRPVESLASSTESLDKFLAAEVEKKQMQEDAIVAAERQRMIEEGLIKPFQEIKRSVILEAVAAREAAYRAAQQTKEVGTNFVNNAVSSVQNTTNFTRPLTTSGEAKIPSTRGNVN